MRGTVGISGGKVGEDEYCWVGKIGICLLYFKNVDWEVGVV